MKNQMKNSLQRNGFNEVQTEFIRDQIEALKAEREQVKAALDKLEDQRSDLLEQIRVLSYDMIELGKGLG